MSARYSLLTLLPLAVSCSITKTKTDDQMCAQVAAFAVTAEQGQSHSIVLRGGWGGDTKNTLVTHDCEYFDYKPGEVFCAYLVPNTSWEFGNYNAKRVASCLDSPARQDFIDRMDNYKVPSEIISSIQLIDDKNILIKVLLNESSNLSVLTLSAVKSDD